MADGNEFDVADVLHGLDGPRPLPPEVTARVLGAVESAGVGLSPGVDGPRPLPPALVDRVSAAMLRRGSVDGGPTLGWLRVGAVATVVVLVAGLVVVATNAAERSRDTVVERATPALTSPPASTSPSTTTTATAPPVSGPPSTTSPADDAIAPLSDSDPAYARLEPFGSCGDLADWVRAAALDEVTASGLNGGRDFIGTPGFPAGGDAAEAALPRTGHSETNVQESGVDEPDMVETDGTTLYATDGHSLQVVSATATPELLSTSTVGRNVSSHVHGLVLDGDRLAAISSDGVHDPRSSGPGTEIHMYAVGDPTRPRLVETSHLDGNYVQARATEHVLHVVTTTAPGPFPFTYPNDDSVEEQQRALEHNRQVIRTSTLEDWLPAGLPCEAVRHPRDLAGFATTTVWSIPFRDPSNVTASAVLADAGTVYASADRLVVATQRWGDIQPDAEAPSSVVRTQLHRFTLTTSGADYVASGQVDGYLYSSYALSEREGYLRVASTDQPSWMAEGSSSSSVTVLGQDGDVLVPVGHIGGLGPGEDVQAVRFVDDFAYVVTFFQVDPLYVIDLRDPTRPRLRGDLHVTGFSGYLHPLAGGRLLGVGIEADDDGNQEGAAVSIYDVSNPDQPMLAQRIVTNRTEYAARWDPHAFLYWEPTGLLVLPGFENRNGQGMADVYRVDAGQLRHRGRIDHTVHNGDVGGSLDRAVYAADILFTVGSGGVLASDPTSLDDLGWVAFPRRDWDAEPVR